MALQKKKEKALIIGVILPGINRETVNENLDEWIIRVRIINNNKSYITLKSSLNRLANYEFEYSIPNEDAIQLFKLSKYKITKTRYQLKTNGKNWVIDSFKGLN